MGPERNLPESIRKRLNQRCGTIIPAYCDRELYHPAVIESTLKRLSASSVAFWLKTEAVDVWNSENAMTVQNIQGSWNIF